MEIKKHPSDLKGTKVIVGIKIYFIKRQNLYPYIRLNLRWSAYNNDPRNGVAVVNPQTGYKPSATSQQPAASEYGKQELTAYQRPGTGYDQKE